MKLLFLDESGTIPPPDKIKDKYFVIGGIIIDENDWHDINRNFNAIKQKYGISADSEIKWRYFSPTNKDNLNSLKHLEQEQKYALRDELYEMIVAYEDIKIIYEISDIKKDYLAGVKNKDELYWISYINTVYRFKDYLIEANKTLNNVSYGIVVIDNRLPMDDKKLRKQHNHIVRILNFLEKWSNSNPLIEEVFISPSHHSMGIQLADIVTGAIYRKYEKNDNKSFSKIKKLIWNAPQKETSR